MATIKSYEELDIWKESMDLAVDIYGLFNEGKLSREYSIKDQILRSSLSMSNNIAEGFEYNNNNEFVRYLVYSKGSVGETRNMLTFMKKAKLITEREANEMIGRASAISGKTGKLISYLKQNRRTRTTTR